MLNKLTNIGLYTDQKPYIQNRIRISNITSLVGFPTGIGYLLLYIYFFPPAVLPFSFCLLVIGLVLPLNYIRLHYLSRFSLSVVMPFVISVIHGYTLPTGASPNIAFMVFISSLTLLPWLLIDIREIVFLIISVLASGSLLLTQPYFIAAFETDYNADVFQTEIFINSLIFLSLFFSGMLLYILNRRTWLSEQKNEDLVHDLSIKNDTLGAQQQILYKQLEEIDQQQTETKNRNWQSQILRSLAKLVQSKLTPEEILKTYLSELVRNVRGQQGAIYLVNQDEEETQHEQQQRSLRLKVAFAHDFEKASTSEVLFGEGFVGQCAINQKLLQIGQLSEVSTKILSGMGQAKPASLVYVPLIFQGNLEGVLEIASFQQAESHELELLEIAGNNLGAWLFNQRTQAYTQQLLKTAQFQADILSQNEALVKQNIQELENHKLTLEQTVREQAKTIEQLSEELNLRNSQKSLPDNT